MSDTTETVKIQSDKGRVPYRIINKADFDPKAHKLFEEAKPAKEKPAKEAK